MKIYTNIKRIGFKYQISNHSICEKKLSYMLQVHSTSLWKYMVSHVVETTEECEYVSQHTT